MGKDFWNYISEFASQFLRRLRSNWRVSLWVCVTIAIASLPLASPLQNEELENNIGRPILFKLRAMAGLAPKIDSRIKIFAFDDASLYELGKPDVLPVETWTEIADALSANNPHVILWDMIFGTRKRNAQELKAFRDLFAKHPTLVTGSYLSPSIISKRPPLDLDQPAFKVPREGLDFVSRYQDSFRHLTPYGPSEDIMPAIKDLGSISFRSPGWIAPVSVFATDRSLTHLSLKAAHAIEYRGEELWVNGKSVPLSSSGEIAINWSNPQEYFQNTAQILQVLQDWRQGKAPAQIQPGDIVIFLPLMYTGSTDFKSTLVGELPGGYSIVSVANSVVTGAWLTTVDLGYFAVLLSLVLGLLSYGFRRTLSAIGYCFAINAITAAAVFYGFAYHGKMLNWTVLVGDFNLTSICLLCSASVTKEIRNLRLRDALKGVISPGLLKKITDDPGNFRLTAEERTITVMFVDLVGFSTSAERLSPQLLFGHLKETLALLTEIVHRHGGIVDKSIGDGLLGFFGYDPLSKHITDDHADRSLACATDIQMTLAKRCCTEQELNRPVFPARIGLNTGPVYIGNLGESDRIDLTVIGNAVNLSKRFEDAAEPFKVLIGPSTRMYLQDQQIRKTVTLRRTSIKHHRALIDAYEYDPLEHTPELFSAAQKSFREYIGIERSSERYLIEGSYVWQISIGGRVAGHVVDYSRCGLSVILENFYANKVRLEFDLILSRKDGGQSESPMHQVTGLVGTICWGRKAEARYKHGLELTEESARRADFERFAPLAMSGTKRSA